MLYSARAEWKYELPVCFCGFMSWRDCIFSWRSMFVLDWAPWFRQNRCLIIHSFGFSWLCVYSQILMVISGCVLIVLRSSYHHLAYVKTSLFVRNWIIFSIVCLGRRGGGCCDTFSGSCAFIRKCSSWITSCVAAKQAEWGTQSADELIACCDSKPSLTQQPVKVWNGLDPVNPCWWDAMTWASPSLF